MAKLYRVGCFQIVLGLFLLSGRAFGQSDPALVDLVNELHNELESNEFASVAVMDFSELGGNFSTLGMATAEEVRVGLKDMAGTYELAERWKTQNVITSKRLSPSFLFDEANAYKLGELFGAEAIITGIAERIDGTECSVTVKILDARSGELVYINRVDYFSDAGLGESKTEAEDVATRADKSSRKKRSKSNEDSYEEEEEEEEEDDERGFSIGLNLGAYFANKKSAGFYNGSCAYTVIGSVGEVRCYDIFERLQLTPQDINYITSYYNITSFEAPIDMYPLNMRYAPALAFGLHIKYNFNRENAIVFNSNFMRLKTTDVFTLRFVGGPIEPNAQQNVQIFDIVGKEDRFQMSLAYRLGAMMNDNANFYFDIGGTMLGTRVISNEIFVADRTYSLFIGAANPQQIINYQPRTDVGFGWMLGTGMEFYFNEKYEMDLGISYSRDKVILGSYEQTLGNIAIMATFTL